MAGIRHDNEGAQLVELHDLPRSAKRMAGIRNRDFIFAGSGRSMTL
jgi:hypothetical protein